jgi:hypothetical protein
MVVSAVQISGAQRGECGVVRQWETQLCLSVDPAICCIISGVLTLLHLRSGNGSNADPELQAELVSYAVPDKSKFGN